VTLKAHGGNIDIEGMCVAVVNDKLQLEKVDVWFDPMAMFRQMKPKASEDPAATQEVIANEVNVVETEVQRA
jgi:hypothetical protein